MVIVRVRLGFVYLVFLFIAFFFFIVCVVGLGCVGYLALF